MLAAKSSEITYSNQLEHVEAELLKLPQVECPVVHHFGPGIYIREVTLPAGTLAIGHVQKFEHLNIMLRGAVAMVDGDQVKVLRAPIIFVGKPGRKLGYILETTTWQNVYATTERDVEKLEATFLEKSKTWSNFQDELLKIETFLHEGDRKDYQLVLEQLGWTEEMVQTQVQNSSDQKPLPENLSAKICIRPSPIHGNGVYSTSPISAGEIIGPARIKGYRTQLGRYVNHSKSPNAYYQLDHNNDVYLVSYRDIRGCLGGDPGEEITVDYRQALSLSGIYL